MASSNNRVFSKGFGRVTDFGFKRIGDLPVGLTATEGFKAAGEGLLGVGDKLFHIEGVGDGLGDNVEAVAWNTFAQYLPEFFFVVGIFVFHVSVDDGIDADLVSFVVNGYGLPADDRQLFLYNRQEFARIKTHAEHGERAAQHAALHIEFDGEIGDIVFRQAYFLPIDEDPDFTEIERVDGFTEILGVAVFPPADTGLVGELHAGDVGAQVAVGGVGSLKAAAYTHIAVAQAGQALLQSFVFFFQLRRT